MFSEDTQNLYTISIKGHHFFACDYVFSNIYGSGVFSEDYNPLDEIAENELFANPEVSALSEKTLEQFSKDSDMPYDISTMPDSIKEIEYSTQGEVKFCDNGSVTIRYSGDFSPICMKVSQGTLSLSGQDDDFSELLFEAGKRNFVALPETLFSNADASENENQSPLQLCLDTKKITLSNDGENIKVEAQYSIEVNGIIAEVSNFVLCAFPILTAAI